MPVTISRRGVLTTVSVPTAFVLSGCLTTSSNGSADDSTDDVQTSRRLLEQPSPGDGVPVVANGLTANSERRRLAWLVRSEDDATVLDADRLRELGAADAASLVTETDFSSSFVLIVQLLLPSRDLTLQLDGVRLEEDGETTVLADVSAGGPGTHVGGGGGELELATLFVRCVPDQSRSVDRAVVTYEGPGPSGSFEATRPRE